MELFDIGFITVRLIDIIDISIVSFIFYKLYGVLKGSVALRVVALIISVFLLWKIVELLDFVLLKSILDEFIGLGAIALVIIFAPEIRRFLTLMSKNTLFDRLIRQVSARAASPESFDEIIQAIKDLRAGGFGALMVLTSNDPLTEIQQTGDQINAELSHRLIVSIFQKYSPLHDGAMIINGDRIAAVRCILPISDQVELAPELGMRHRAALGISEVSNALVIIISEERRELSIAQGGKLSRGVDYTEVKEAILRHNNQSLSVRLETDK